MTEVVPEQLCTLAGHYLGASQELNDSWTGSLGALSTPTAAFGNTGTAGTAAGANQQVVSKAQSALDRMVAVMENDMDDLYACAFAYSSVDESNASNLESAYPQPPDPSPGPSPEPEPQPSPTA